MPAGRRPLLLAIGAAWILVVARSAVFLLYPQSRFDSDEAIVGLMAKHLIEGRAFPLFFYGQTYLLGVEAWVASLFFLIGGPTVTALHLAQLSWNLAAAALVVTGLVRWGGLRPMAAVAASLFFTIAPPATSELLMTSNGGNVEPLVYVPLLWFVRDRPLWFGGLLGLGVLNREFTIYAAPALAAVRVATAFGRADAGCHTFAKRVMNAAGPQVRWWLLAGVAFFAVIQSVEALKPLADLRGPGTRGQALEAAAGSLVGNLRDRMAVDPADLLTRVRQMATEHVPRQLGAPQWLYGPLAVLLLFACGRAAWLVRRRGGSGAAGGLVAQAPFAWYLLYAGMFAAAGYVVSRPSEYTAIHRYMLLALFAPIGLAAAALALEPRAGLRRAVAAGVVVWALGSAVQHQRLLAGYWRGDVPDDAQRLADGLVERGVRVAAAGYWRSYKLTFLARERVKVASLEMNRIDEYQVLADAEGPSLVVLRTEPCASDLPPIGGWHLCRKGSE